MKSPVSLCALLLFAVSVSAAPPVPQPPSLKARSYVLQDYDSGQIVAAHEPALRVEPASLAKLMTLYVAFDQIRNGQMTMNDSVLISEKAWRAEGSRTFLEVGKRASVEVLLRGIVIQSGNDASIALAEHIAGAEDVFADLMNRYARNLGLKQTHYVNATGLPHPDMLTSARDTAVLSRALIRDFPELYAMFKEKAFVHNNIRQPNRNLLLWQDPSVDGIKTGHTESAGYHLAASAVRDGYRLISVVIGMDSEPARAKGSLALLNYGFRFFETVPAVAAGVAITTVRAWKGAETELALGVSEALRVSVPRGGADRLTLRPHVDGPVFAPVAAGARLGTVTVELEGDPLRSVPLVALGELPEGGLWRRLADEVLLRIEGISPP